MEKVAIVARSVDGEENHDATLLRSYLRRKKSDNELRYDPKIVESSKDAVAFLNGERGAIVFIGAERAFEAEHVALNNPEVNVYVTTMERVPGKVTYVSDEDEINSYEIEERISGDSIFYH